MSKISVAPTWPQGELSRVSELLPHLFLRGHPLRWIKVRQFYVARGKSPGFNYFIFLWCQEEPFQGLLEIVFGVCIHNTHVVDTVHTLLTDILDKRISFLLWVLLYKRSIVELVRSVKIVPDTSHGTTCMYEGFVVNVCGREGISFQVCDTFM